MAGPLHDDDTFEAAAKALAQARHAICLTGAGISAESGIPDFRSAGGLWERFDPMEYAHIEVFRQKPEQVWEMLHELNNLVLDARPNPAHKALAELERLGVIQTVITQNFDNLHQDGGSQSVIEFHGNGKRLICLDCGADYDSRKISRPDAIPRCRCGAVLKPDVIFFGEAIPPKALYQSNQEAQSCDVIIVAGTSATVAPASYIPMLAKQKGAVLIELNLTKTVLTDLMTDHLLLGPLGQTLPALTERVRALRNGH